MILMPQNAATREYNNYINTAKDYYSRGLYQKSIEQYDMALQLNNNPDAWNQKLDAYDRLYEENDTVYSDFLSAAQTAYAFYPDNKDFLIRLCELYVSKDDYKAAYKTLDRAIQNGITNDTIEEMLFTTKYAFKLRWATYDDYIGGFDKGYGVVSSERWSYIKNTGETTKFPSLLFAGPIGANDVRVVTDANRSYLIDADMVIQGILDFTPTDAGYFSEDLVPIKNGDHYGYYDILGDYQFGDYEEAGSFHNGTAAVKSNGSWYIIDNKGDSAGGSYEEIVLYPDGSYINNGVMIVKENGKYHIYNNDEDVGEFVQIGIPTKDGLIAAYENNRWGFVDTNGHFVIEPQFVEARSFSNGLAAVFDGTSWGFINTDGELAIDYQFDDVGYFDNFGNCMINTEMEDSYSSDGTIRHVWKLLNMYNWL